jgi:hypothetical protein
LAVNLISETRKLAISRGVILSLLFLSAGLSQGQVMSLNHPVAPLDGVPLPANSSIPGRVNAVGTVNVLAVMVQFQTETDSLITGDGHFLMNQGTGLDAPPHDKAYFENHLLFLKNYYRKVSGGKLDINYDVLDSVVTLPYQMKHYATPKSSIPTNLGLLFQDTWQYVDSLYHGTFPFGQYQCFVIFHAGAGHDIDFTTQLGYDPYPYNIPSIYMNLRSLQSVFGQNYVGAVVHNGQDTIRNSIIMPESESYPALNLTLGTNGLLAASFGSFLGLPDLFNTRTGVTGIGRFGLMDGQAIFAYGGIFPPEPSAWEKVYLGWVIPIDISPSTSTQYRLYANEMKDPVTGSTKYSVLKVPINGTEYFLLENREGDAHHDGEIVTSIYNGKYDTTHIDFANDTAYFDGAQIKKINGVVTDADEYDWALPQDTTFFGGILIWHIDQSVISQNLETNTINANPDHRGVALMEAHGANEIGDYIQSVFGSYYYDGSPTDFWYKGNPARSSLQKVGGNQFTPTTLPNSNGYNGANSHIYITNFSDHDSVMTFNVVVDSISANFSVTSGFPKNIYGVTTNSSPVFGHLSQNGNLQVIANNGDSLYAFNMDGSSAGFDSTGFFSGVGGKFQPIIASSENAVDTVYATNDSTLYALIDRDDNHDGTADTVFSVRARQTGLCLSAPILITGNKIIVVSRLPRDTSEALSVFSLSGKFIGQYTTPTPTSTSPSALIARSAEDSVGSSFGRLSVVDTGTIILNSVYGGVFEINIDRLVKDGDFNSDNVSNLSPASTTINSISYAKLLPHSNPWVIELSDNSVYIDSADGSPCKIFSAFPGDTIVSGPVIADLDGDGNRDIVFGTQTKVYAVSYTGGVLNHFPISTVGSEILSAGANRIVGSIAVAALTGDTADVVFGTEGGTLYAFNGVTGQLVAGFPLSVGGGLAGSPALAYDASDSSLYLAAIGKDGYLYSWTFKGNYSKNPIQWGNLLHDTYHSNSVTSPAASSLFPPPFSDTTSLVPKVYNWPNPVTTGVTKIRFYLNKDARVMISIFSFAGDKVADLPMVNGVGGTYGEVDWDVAGVQSGVYFARVEAVSSNQRVVKIVKIAVVK